MIEMCSVRNIMSCEAYAMCCNVEKFRDTSSVSLVRKGIKVVYD